MATKIKKDLPSSMTFPKDYKLEEQGLSQSLISIFLRCKRAFLYAVNRYAHPSKLGVTNFGSMFHDVIARCYKLGAVPTNSLIDTYINDYQQAHANELKIMNDVQKIERDSAMVYAVTSRYVQHYKKDIESCRYDVIEKEFDVNFNGIQLRGKIDARFLTKHGKRWQMEHKTKGRISEDSLQKRLTFDPQNLLYLLAGEIAFADEVDGVLYNIVRNPQLKQKVGESLQAFQERVIADINERPEFYFMQFEIPYTERDKRQFKAELEMIINDITRAIRCDTFYKNGFACDIPYECQYLNACSSNSFDGYIKRDKLFTELDDCEY